MSTRLLCWVKDTPSHKIFPVDIKNNAIWGGVKDGIKVKKKPEFDDIAADALDLWKVTMKGSQRKSLLGSAHYLASIVATEPLDSTKSVLTDFHPPPDDHIHIIIVRRPRVDSNRGFSIDAHWSPRADTVCRLFDVLQNERLVHVRGTPGSGKTTLKELLHAYIIKTFPSSYVHVVDSWPPSNALADSDLTARLRLVDPAYPQPNSPTFLLFDDGQDTYEDVHLWNTFFKRVHDGLDNYFVVLFCSYGSPSASPLIYRKGTAPLLRPAARVSLWHEKHSIGLLLNPTEFDEVVAGYANKPERNLTLDPKLKAHFYDLTGGHVGAVIELLHLISNQRVAETPFTVDAFIAENPTRSLMQWLSSGAFGRSLTQPSDLKEYPHITGFFRNLIRHTEFEEGVVEDAAAQICHRRGWLHSYMNEEGSTHYTFSSPPHSAYISWLLAPSDNMPTYPSAFKLCLAAISNFKPSQMHIPIRRVGVPSPITLPEAQYQDEFYRAVFSVTAGSVCISQFFAFYWLGLHLQRGRMFWAALISSFQL